jgi:NDP-sugar pyrophosphorylase family protein
MYMTDFLQHLIESGWRVQAVPVDGGWLEVDTPQDLQVYENLYRAGELARFYRLAEEANPRNCE